MARDYVSHAGSRRRCPPPSDLSQWCCHWVRSSGCLLSVVAGGGKPGGSPRGASRCAVLSPGRTAAAGWRRPTASRTAPWGTAHPAISVSAETSQNERIVNVPSSPRPAHHHRSGQGRAAVTGKAAVKRNRFIHLSGGTRSVNRELEEKGRDQSPSSPAPTPSPPPIP